MRRGGGLMVGLVLGLAGCGSRTGVGQARGEIFILTCNDRGDFGTREAPRPFDLRPEFFGGEPIEDVRSPRRENRLIIRMQRSGKRAEFNDVLSFDIVNSYEVARCVRGQGIDGAPDPRHCFRAPGRLPRIRVAPDSLIRAYFAPRSTCSQNTVTTLAPVTKNVVATAVAPVRPENDGNWTSYIEFEKFGDSEPQPPGTARKPLGKGFKVNFGEELQATFHLALEDMRVFEAIDENEPVPEPEMGGTLDGSFDFDLERGQGKQTFP